MKIVQAMKLSKELLVKADDLRKKIAAHSAHLNIETSVYKEQAKEVANWLQSHYDIMREIGRLRVAIAKTNLATLVIIKVGDANVEKTITEWIFVRTVGAPQQVLAWSQLTDRNLKEQVLAPTNAGAEPTKISIVRCFDPKRRDEQLAIHKDVPGLIDRTLEVVNATTDLIE